MHALADELRALQAGDGREQALARAPDFRRSSDALIALIQALAGSGRR